MWPAQKRFVANGTAVNAPVLGFQSRSEFGASANPSQEITLPVGSSAMCTATVGHAIVSDHCPTWLGGGPPDELAPLPQMEAGPSRYDAPVDHEAGSEVRVVCTDASTGEPLPQQRSRNLTTPPLPSSAIQ